MDLMKNNLSHFDVMLTILSTIPSVISIFIAFSNTKKGIGYEIVCILIGFCLFPNNQYVKLIIAAFVCSLIIINYNRIHNGKIFSGLLFPSVFFLNLTTFSGITITENIFMVFYAIATGAIYIIELIMEKDNNSADFIVKNERSYIMFSAFVLISSKVSILMVKILE